MIGKIGGNEISGPIKGWEFVDCLRNYQLFKKYSAPFSYLVSQFCCVHNNNNNVIITVFTRARHWSLFSATLIQALIFNLFSYDSFEYYTPIYTYPHRRYISTLK
jgi:hypothetical protein